MPDCTPEVFIREVGTRNQLTNLQYLITVVVREMTNGE